MERCSSSTSYMDYRHSMASNNFCYPYSPGPGMMRSGIGGGSVGSPYPLGGGGPGAPRYGTMDYRSGGYYGEGFDKYYGAAGYHSGYGANYYGNGYGSYRDFGYNDYYQGFGGHHGGGFHGPHLYGGRQSLPLAFQRDSYYHPREHPGHHGPPYGFGGNYSGAPYKGDSSSSTNSSETALFGTNGGSFQHSPDYPYGSSGDSPVDGRSSGGPPGYPSPPSSSSSSAMPNATGFPLSIKDARMRKLKERKLAKSSASYSPGGSGTSTSSSPNPVGSSGSNPGANSAGGQQRLKASLDALGSDTFDHHERPGKNSPSSRHPSPGRAAGIAGSGGGGSPPKRSKKQTNLKHGRGSLASTAVSAPDNDKPGDPGAMATPDKNVTPLPGFQQAFGSTEIGKFSEAFFNSSPGPTPPDLLGHHQHPDSGAGHHHPHPHHHQLMMAATGGCESDVDTLSPQPWEPTGPGDPFHDGTTGTPTYNLQIGTSFHPAYYESSATGYATTDHAIDSPLGNYFSEMTCNEYVT